MDGVVSSQLATCFLPNLPLPATSLVHLGTSLHLKYPQVFHKDPSNRKEAPEEELLWTLELAVTLTQVRSFLEALVHEILY